MSPIIDVCDPMGALFGHFSQIFLFSKMFRNFLADHVHGTWEADSLHSAEVWSWVVWALGLKASKLMFSDIFGGSSFSCYLFFSFGKENQQLAS